MIILIKCSYSCLLKRIARTDRGQGGGRRGAAWHVCSTHPGHVAQLQKGWCVQKPCKSFIVVRTGFGCTTTQDGREREGIFLNRAIVDVFWEEGWREEVVIEGLPPLTFDQFDSYSQRPPYPYVICNPVFSARTKSGREPAGVAEHDLEAAPPKQRGPKQKAPKTTCKTAKKASRKPSDTRRGGEAEAD